MQAPLTVEIDLPDEAATTRLGALLADGLRPGDTLLLSGPIGAGKTHLARAIIGTRLARSGLSEDIPSPTFTLVQTYDDAVCEIWHADLYRLGHADEVIELGLADAFGAAIVIIEWPDRLGGDAPSDALSIALAATRDGSSRTATLTADTGRWGDRISTLNTSMERTAR